MEVSAANAEPTAKHSDGELHLDEGGDLQRLCDHPGDVPTFALGPRMNRVIGPAVVEEKGRTGLGLYRLQGNTLTLSVGNENRRPASLEDASAQVMVFTRVRR